MKNALIIIFLIINTIASATDYYISSSGNDSNNGLSSSKPWKTIAKVNASSFSPGDTIFFNKGDTWREQLTVPSSGKEDAYIVFCSYGIGLAPKILGSTEVTSWTNDEGNIWYSNIAVNDPYALTFDGNIYFKKTVEDISWGRVKKSTKGALAMEYDWIWMANRIYIYSPTDPNTRYLGVEVAQRIKGIELNNKEFLTIDGLEIAYSGSWGIGDLWNSTNISGLIIKNCHIHHIGIKASTAAYGIEEWHSNSLLQNNIIHDCGRRNISLNIYTGAVNVHDITVENNTLYHGFHTTGVDISSEGTGSINKIIIRKNLIYDEASETLNEIESFHSRGLWISNEGSGTFTNIYIYNNTFKNTTSEGMIINNVTSSYIYNNTFFGVNPNLTDYYGFILLRVGTNSDIKNNIFYSNADHTVCPYFFGLWVEKDAGIVTSDYNLFYNTDAATKLIAWRVTNYASAQWTNYKLGSGQDAHSPLPTNPLFVSSSDYHLQAGSPAIDAGVDVGLPFSGKAPDLGAFEAQTASPAPIPEFISSAVENSTSSILEMIYNISLANVAPAASAFSVRVNSVTRNVNTVAISGTRVLLTLASPIISGDIVTITYTKPTSNPLQTALGGQAVTISFQPVTNNVNSPVPVYVSSVVENATPSLLVMTYNMALANLVPATSAFLVGVNYAYRTVNSIVISGTKVQLTLASPIISGDIVTITYTKPSSNPLQTASGGQAVTISSQPVTNNVNSVVPVYVSSVVANATPSILEMTYNLTLANIIPAASAFSVGVNSVARTVNTIVISGTKVQLTLASPIISGDIVTITYTKPSSNPLQTALGGHAVTISAQPVINNCINVAPTVVISSPISNSSFTDIANITITANATDPDGSINMVEFYNAGTKIGTMTAAPYSFIWNNVAVGTYSLSVVVTDNLNAKTTSSAISISVINGTTTLNQPPVVTISNPRKGNKYENPATITIDAVASDPDGTISKVGFYNGAVKLFELTLAPYTYTWKDVAAGTYTLTAIATDNLNATTTSSPVEFVVGPNIKHDANSEITNLYPNPNDGHFSIEFVNPLQNERSEIIITDLVGRRVYKGILLKEETIKQIDISSIKSGIYLLMIFCKEILVTKKIIKY